jgi:hypothetical protein
MGQWTPEGREPTTANSAALAADIERIAWKERRAAAPPVYPSQSIADKLFTSSAFRPGQGAVTKPILTLQEFADSSMGKSASGTPLTGASLTAKWQKFHKDMIATKNDRSMNITKAELEDIMLENAPNMKSFFIAAGRKTGTRATQIPKKYRGKQQGNVNQQLLTIMGGAGMFALIGYGKDNDINDAIAYALGAGATLAFGGKVLRKWATKWPVTNELIKGKKGANIDDAYNQFQGDGAVYERRLKQQHNAMLKVSGAGDPTEILKNTKAKKLRESVTDAIEDPTGKLYAKLPEHGKELYKMAKDILKKAGKTGKERGILRETIENYVPHAYQHFTKSTDDMLSELFGTKTRAEALDTIHRKSRVIPSYDVALKLGLKPRTKDIADIITMYLKSMDQAHRANIMFDALKKTKSPLDNMNIIKRAKDAPKTYQTIKHPKFDGYKVHPDVAPALKAMFDATDFNALYRGALGLNFLLKRQAVSISGFHGKALLFSALMASGPKGIAKGLIHPIRSAKDVINLFRGQSTALKIFNEVTDSPTSKEIDAGLRAGLTVNIVDDVGKDTFYEFMDDIGGVFKRSYEKNIGNLVGKAPLHKKVGSAIGLPVSAAMRPAIKGLENANKIVDAVMWDRIYTGLKLQTYLTKMEKLSAKYGHTTPLDELRQAAAEYTNDAFGGLNWVRLAQNVESKYASKIAYGFTGRSGRAFQQMAMFAPDWTASQIRVFYKAFANKNPIQRELYQQYQYTGLLMFLLGADAINLMSSGHHIWENKDLSTIDLGDGRRLSLSKQYYEPAKWIWHPEQSAMNKLSTVIRTGIELGKGEKYIRHGSAAPPIESRIGHIASKTMPIWAANMRDYGLGQGLASMAGFPMYGEATSGGSLRDVGVSRGGGTRGGISR